MTNKVEHAPTILDGDGTRLASEVLLQAIRDVFGSNEERSCDRHAIAAKSEAYQFLTAQAGSWRQSRRDWCDLAGIDPDSFERGIANRLRRKAITAATIAQGEVTSIVRNNRRSQEYLRRRLARRAAREQISCFA